MTHASDPAGSASVASHGFRRDFARLQRHGGDGRSPARLMAHYQLERELSDRLRCASRAERPTVYAAVYRELFTSLPDHPQHGKRRDGAVDRIEGQLRKIAAYLGSASVFLEIGCGDGLLAFAAARQISTAYGLDVTDVLVDFKSSPSNFQFVQSTGVDIPLPTACVDLAYSNQLMEHLHPDDARDQLREIVRVLKPGGRYICITPSRVTGPHDISRYFDYESTCFHLREYDYGALRRLFGEAGFSKFSCFASIRGRQIRMPYPTVRALELALLALPPTLRAHLEGGPLEAVMGLNVIGVR